MKVRVYFTNKQSKRRIGARLTFLIEKAIEKTLRHERFKKNAELSVTFVDNEEIRNLNLDARGKDSATDVLSFPMLETEDDGTLIIYDEDIVDGRVLLGDIVISAERAHEQAEEYGHSLVREMCFLAVHSVLHLLGYDHERSEAEEKIQFEKQEEILNILGITR